MISDLGPDSYRDLILYFLHSEIHNPQSAILSKQPLFSSVVFNIKLKK